MKGKRNKLSYITFEFKVLKLSVDRISFTNPFYLPHPLTEIILILISVNPFPDHYQVEWGSSLYQISFSLNKFLFHVR